MRQLSGPAETLGTKLEDAHERSLLALSHERRSYTLGRPAFFSIGISFMAIMSRA